MAITRVHTLGGVNIDTKAGANLFISQVSNVSLDTGIEQIIEAGGGEVDATFSAIAKQNAKITFTSSQLAAILALVGIGGLNVESDVTNDGLEFFFQKIAEGGTRTAGATHLKLTMNKGMLFSRQISADQEKLATVNMEAIATWDGTNDPFVIEDNMALEGVAGVNEGFVSGPVKINGVTLEGVQEITIDLGIQEIVINDGVHASFAAIQSRRPVITIKTTDTVSMSTFGLAGTAQGATDSVIYLRKVAEGGTRVADATAQHISFTVDDGMITVNSVEASDGDIASSEVVITPTYDGTNAILVINTATAII